MTPAQRRARARRIVAAAARKEGVSWSEIGRAFALSRQRVKAIVEEARRDLAVKTGGGDFVGLSYREANYEASATRQKLRSERD